MCDSNDNHAESARYGRAVICQPRRGLECFPLITESLRNATMS